MQKLEQIASQVRRDVIRMVSGAQSGHPGGSLGCADFLTVLYFDIMKYNPSDFTMDGIGEDVFFLSNGHLSPVWYSVLARAGYFEIEELATFRKLGTRLQGHPCTHDNLPGIRMASGSLGQGISVGIGTAISKKMNNDPNFVHVLTGDGELQEGQIWEAALFAAAHKIDNIIVTVDYNKKQIDGPTDEVISLGDLHAKWEAFGWMVMETDGHNIPALQDTLKTARENTGHGKPIVILMHSEMGQGVDFMMGTHKWRGSAPNAEQTEKALAQLTETLGDY